MKFVFQVSTIYTVFASLILSGNTDPDEMIHFDDFHLDQNRSKV